MLEACVSELRANRYSFCSAGWQGESCLKTLSPESTIVRLTPGTQSCPALAFFSLYLSWAVVVVMPFSLSLPLSLSLSICVTFLLFSPRSLFSIVHHVCLYPWLHTFYYFTQIWACAYIIKVQNTHTHTAYMHRMELDWVDFVIWPQSSSGSSCSGMVLTCICSCKLYFTCRVHCRIMDRTLNWSFISQFLSFLFSPHWPFFLSLSLFF